MFSATRFVVAGVIVALFGGFLLAGDLTRRGDEPLPAVGASASGYAVRAVEPSTAVASAAAEETVVLTDVLPGVNLVTTELRPGVFRVLSDGRRDLSESVWNVAVSREGVAFVEKHWFKYLPNAPIHLWETKNSRILRLGSPGEVRLPIGNDLHMGLGVLDDGAIQAAGWNREKVFDGSRWIDGDRYRPAQTDALRCDTGYEPGIHCDGPAGEIGTTFAEAGYLGARDGAVGMEDRPPHRFASADDGRVWLAMNTPGSPGFKVSVFDGRIWTQIPTDGLAAEWADESSASTKVDGTFFKTAVGPDGTFWASDFDPDLDFLRVVRWDGTSWTAFDPVELTFKKRTPPESGIVFSRDGIIWFDGLVSFDGTSFTHHPVPASPDNRTRAVHGFAHAPDGSLLVVVIHDSLRNYPAPGCPARARKRQDCPPVTDGLYVITPDATGVDR